MLRRGDIDEKGRVFVGYRKMRGKTYEWWASSMEAYKRREARRYEAIKRWTIEKKKDPEFRKKLSIENSARNKLRRTSDPAYYLLAGARRRAKISGLEFAITKEDCAVPSICPVLGIPLRPATGCADDNSPELDRVDNTKGYVKGNVMVISRRANRIKNNSTIEELRLILEYVSRFYNDKAKAA